VLPKDRIEEDEMSTRTALMGLVTGAVLLGGGLFAVTQTASAAPGTAGTVTATPALTGELRFAREEERMARDLYRAIDEKYDAAPFAMIATSEQRHFDAVGTLLDRYGVADPADGRKAGSYADPTIQQLYDGWLADAGTSLDAAYDVGVALEQRDIADLQDTLAQDPPADVSTVLKALLNGSQHHLAAFRAAADGQVLGLQGGQGWMNGQGQGQGRGWSQGNGPGTGNGMGMMNGRGNGASLGGDCPMLDAS
jgi:hypothetical protein